MEAFHYVVRVKQAFLIKEITDIDIDFKQFEIRIEDKNPIIAREKAFNTYNSFISTIFGKGKSISQKELNSFVETGISSTIIVGTNEVSFKDSFSNGIGIFMIIKKPNPEKYSNKKMMQYFGDKVNDEYFIHGIGHIYNNRADPNRIIHELEEEAKYYSYYNYETKNKEIEVLFCDRDEWLEGFRDDEPSYYKILKTPFDWKGLDKPYWWENYDKTINTDKDTIPVNIEEIIKGGESNQVEFKPTLLYNFKSGKAGIGIKYIIAKTICSFLNSNGGILLIGLNDNGIIQGLDNDYQLSNGKDQKDFFRLEFDQMLSHFLSFSVKSNITTEFYNSDGKDLFVIRVTPNKRRPIFLKGREKKEFYVRGEASSRQLHDIEDIINYCLDRFIT